MNGVFTELSIHHRTDICECKRKFCKYLSLSKSSFIKTYFRRVSSEANKKQGLCEISYDLNLCCMRLTSVSECECNIMLNNDEKETYEMLGSMYVSFIVKISET